MDVYRIGIKFFATDPDPIRPERVVSVFHSWIQQQAVPEHLLIDVHNYGHVHHGPGILLVAHEGNFSVDMAGGRPGLLYYRKQPRAGSGEDRLLTVLRPALLACALLEEDAAFEGSLRFRTSEFHLIANDRLHAPNEESTMASLAPVLSSVLTRVLDSSDLTIMRLQGDPRERLTIRVQSPRNDSVRSLLARIV